MSALVRLSLVDWADPVLSVVAQCRLLKIARSTLYYHVWTARRVQVGFQDTGVGSNAVMCPAFDAGRLSAGPDGIRERHPNNRAAYYCHWY